MLPLLSLSERTNDLEINNGGRIREGGRPGLPIEIGFLNYRRYTVYTKESENKNK